MGEARGTEPRAPGARRPGPGRRRAPREASAPGAPPVPARSCGARPTCGGAGEGLHLPNRVRAIVKALAECSLRPPVHALLPGRPEVTARTRGAHTSAGGGRREAEGRGGRRRAGRLQAGTRGAAARKSYLRVTARRTRLRGHPLALGEPALVAATGAQRGARAGGGTCGAGRLGVGAGPAERRRRSGCGGGERSSLAEPPAGPLTPHPAAWQTPSCDSVSPRIRRRASPPLGRQSRVRSLGNGRARGRGRAPLLPRAGERPRASGWGGVLAEIPGLFLEWDLGRREGKS